MRIGWVRRFTEAAPAKRSLSQKATLRLHPKELLNKALVAASVAESEGYHATSLALREVAAWLYTDFLHANPNEIAKERALEPLMPENSPW